VCKASHSQLRVIVRRTELYKAHMLQSMQTQPVHCCELSSSCDSSVRLGTTSPTRIVYPRIFVFEIKTLQLVLPMYWGLGFGVWGLGFGVWGLGEAQNFKPNRKTTTIFREKYHNQPEKMTKYHMVLTRTTIDS
jgi:hypothetical protein